MPFRMLLVLVTALALPACMDSSPSTPAAADAFTWSTAAVLQNTGFNRAADVQVSGLPGGKALAIWTVNESDLGMNTYRPGEIHSSLFTPGTGWSTASLLEAGDTPQLATNASGTTVAIWQSSSGLRASVHRPAAGWNTPEDMSSGGTPQGAHFVAVDAAGNAMALWAEGDLSYTSLYASRLVAGGTWGAPQELATYDVGFANAEGLAMNPDGEAMVIWNHYNGSDYSVHAQRYTPADGWQGSTALVTGNSSDGEPQVAIDASGNAIAVWTQGEVTGNSLQARRFSAGSLTWAAATPIQADATRVNSTPILGSDAAGNILALWTYWGSSRTDIQGNVYTTGGGWGSAASLDSGTTLNSSSPRLAVAANGTALAIWQRSDGSVTNLYSSRYRPETGWAMPLAIGKSHGTGSGIETALAVDAAGRGTLLAREMTFGGLFMYTLEALRFE